MVDLKFQWWSLGSACIKPQNQRGKRQRLRCWFDIGSLTLSQVIQQALHRPPSSAAQYLQQMYAAQQQHLMLHTAALQQQHLSSSQLQSLAAVQVRTQRTVCQIVTAENKQAGVLSAFLTSVIVSPRGDRYKYTGRRMDRFCMLSCCSLSKLDKCSIYGILLSLKFQGQH